ncbi:hypothetical protein ACFWDI_26110 [Streptomyces sp. NPDC060064]|uniref:hypothetical protein n=1 Tax=Streptomyces sp. NPDC060064 TaxID=3347049 RepID=UPI0036CB458F
MVIADARAVRYEESFGMLEDMVREHPGAFIVGTVTSSRCALVWVRAQPRSV